LLTGRKIGQFFSTHSPRTTERIDPDELLELRRVGSNWLNSPPKEIAEAIEIGLLKEADLDA